MTVDSLRKEETIVMANYVPLRSRMPARATAATANNSEQERLSNRSIDWGYVSQAIKSARS